jgi:hydrogenase nickel incorporation protein HypA/HybF
MHELAIAQAIFGIAERHADGRPVTAVDVKVGHLRQVVPSALTFAFELVSDGTALQGAELRIEEVPAAGICRACGAESVLPDFPLSCARCGALDIHLTSGEELLVDSLEIEELALQSNSSNGGGHGNR